MTTDERTTWLQSLKPGDVVVTVDAMSRNRVRVREHKVSKASDREWLRFTGHLSGIGFRRTENTRFSVAYLLPNTPDVIEEESAIALHRLRVRQAEFRIGNCTDSQLERIEAILAERKPRKKGPADAN